MIVVNAIIESTEHSIAALKAAVADMENASRLEAGCLDYTFSVELNNPNVLRITERWETLEALKAHFTVPHMAQFQEGIAAHPPKSTEIKIYEATEVKLG
jgi:quinol monooxygenase YgiN